MLFVEAAPRMTCPICKEKRLHAVDHDPSDEDDADWQSAVLCEVCRQPIPPERIEALPGVKRCVACQGRDEAGPLVERAGVLSPLRLARRNPRQPRHRHHALQAVCTGEPPAASAPASRPVPALISPAVAIVVTSHFANIFVPQLGLRRDEILHQLEALVAVDDLELDRRASGCSLPARGTCGSRR